jgi:hypothetical protein
MGRKPIAHRAADAPDGSAKPTLHGCRTSDVNQAHELIAAIGHRCQVAHAVKLVMATNLPMSSLQLRLPGAIHIAGARRPTALPRWAFLSPGKK